MFHVRIPFAPNKIKFVEAENETKQTMDRERSDTLPSSRRIFSGRSCPVLKKYALLFIDNNGLVEEVRGLLKSWRTCSLSQVHFPPTGTLFHCLLSQILPFFFIFIQFSQKTTQTKINLRMAFHENSFKLCVCSILWKESGWIKFSNAWSNKCSFQPIIIAINEFIWCIFSMLVLNDCYSRHALNFSTISSAIWSVVSRFNRGKNEMDWMPKHKMSLFGTSVSIVTPIKWTKWALSGAWPFRVGRKKSRWICHCWFVSWSSEREVELYVNKRNIQLVSLQKHILYVSVGCYSAFQLFGFDEVAFNLASDSWIAKRSFIYYLKTGLHVKNENWEREGELFSLKREIILNSVDGLTPLSAYTNILQFIQKLHWMHCIRCVLCCDGISY